MLLICLHFIVLKLEEPDDKLNISKTQMIFFWWSQESNSRSLKQKVDYLLLHGFCCRVNFSTFLTHFTGRKSIKEVKFQIYVYLYMYMGMVASGKNFAYQYRRFEFNPESHWGNGNPLQSCSFAWRIPWTEQSGCTQCHWKSPDTTTQACSSCLDAHTHAFMHVCMFIVITKRTGPELDTVTGKA